MLDFLKKTKEETEEIEQQLEDYNEQEDVLNITHLLEQIEYTNTYLAQLLMVQRELLKQQTVANGLHLLDAQYNHADSFMKVDEIQQKYLALASEIFVDYSEVLSNLEEKD